MRWSLFFILVALLACKNKTESKPATASQPYLQAATLATITQQATNMDIIFYNMDISVSQTDKASIMQTVNFISPIGKNLSDNCPSIGRLMFQENGKILLEADIHLSGNCSYFTIIENKQPKGTNAMSSDGNKFLSQLINSYRPK